MVKGKVCGWSNCVGDRRGDWCRSPSPRSSGFKEFMDVSPLETLIRDPEQSERLADTRQL